MSIYHQDHWRQTLRTHRTRVYLWLLCLGMKFLLSRSAVQKLRFLQWWLVLAGYWCVGKRVFQKIRTVQIGINV